LKPAHALGLVRFWKQIKPHRWGVKNLFLQNAYYYLSTTYKFLEKQAFSFQFLLLKKLIEIGFLPTVEMTTMFGQGLGRGKADAKRPLFPSQSPHQGLCHFDGSASWRRLRNLFYDNFLKITDITKYY
jgi:hypothetical protein